MMPEALSNGEVASGAARPFPWFCPKCRRKEVRRVTIPYECELVHEGRPVTVVVPNFAVPKCSNCGELVFDYEADDQINRALQTTIEQGAVVPTSASPGEHQGRYPEPSTPS